VHDPSGVMWEEASQRYYSFGTGLLPKEFLASHVSKDGYNWNRTKAVFDEMPSWVHDKVPLNTGTFWAPDIVYLNGLWHLYYAVSEFGGQVSCIALVTSPSLDASNSTYGWTDQGPVLCSSSADPYNCIDPHIFTDKNSGRVYMNWGSYWHGIYIQELSGETGVYNNTYGTYTHIASDPQASDKNIEASWIEPSPLDSSTYWLFVNYGYCCRGVNSTYNIRIGVSTKGPLGPYLDSKKVDMVQGGGDVFMKTDGRQIGPGQIGFARGPASGPAGNGKTTIVSYHYYDRDSNPPGARTLGQAAFTWGKTPTALPTISDRE